MDKQFTSNIKNGDPIDRVDARLKVTGTAKYSAEYVLPGMVYAVLAGSTIAKGSIESIHTKTAENAPGVMGVITHLNAPIVPGYPPKIAGEHKRASGTPLKLFYDEFIYFNGQPIAMVIADTFERALYAASLIKAKYKKETAATDINANLDKAVAPKRQASYLRGAADAWKTAAVKLEQEYIMPIEVHNPMELHSTIAYWEGDKLTVYDKTQGVKSTQRSLMQTFKLKEEQVQVNAGFVGGGFGSALRTWPHVIAAVMAAKKYNRPVKLVLGRDQMFTLVGYRPFAIQKIGMGATVDGKLTGITHEAISETSSYEEFTEGIVNATKFLYDCPNVNTRYSLVPLDLSTPTWMRGPGEATGTFALESAMDELADKLHLDPIELRLRNYAETDPETKKPFSSKFLKECYALGAEKIGWEKRSSKPGSITEDGMLAGYGMSTGTFGAFRGTAKAAARLMADGSLLVQSAVSDSGPGTATAMVQIAADSFGLPTKKVSFELGDSSLPPGPTQGGSATTSTLGSAVHDACKSLQKKLAELASQQEVFHTADVHAVKAEDLVFENGEIILKTDRSKKISYADLLKKSGLNELEATEESKGGAELQKYSMYSFSVHFVKVHVHPATGVVRIQQVATVADAGKIINEKTAASQMIGGVTGGIGMALTEEGVIDHRYGRWVNNNLADYHVPVHADVPHIDALFVNKPDPVINPMGSKGMGEIALIGFAAAVANAVYNATGKRIRELPITPDKLI